MFKLIVFISFMFVNSCLSDKVIASDFNDEFISKTQAKKDINYFFHKYKKIHPNPYFIYSKSSLDSIKHDLINSLPNNISRYDMWKLMNTKLSLLLNAHTRFEYLPLSSKNNLFFPYNISVDYNQCVYVSDNKKIISINNVSIERIIANFSYELPLENKLTSLMFMQDLFPIVLNSFFGQQKYFLVNYEKGESRYVDTVFSVPLDEYVKINKKCIIDNEYRIINSNAKKIMYVRYVDFSLSNIDKIQKMTDSVFSVIKSEKISTLVIDLRNNTGGSSFCTDIIENYIYGEKIKSSYTTIKNSKDYRRLINVDSFWDRFKSKFLFDVFILRKKTIKFNGDVVCQNTRTLNKFSGDILILVSPMTSSASADFAYHIKLNKVGSIIGSGIGQPARNFTDAREFLLKESNIKFFLPTQESVYKNIPLNKGFLKMDYSVDFQSPIDFNNDSLWMRLIQD